MSEIKANNESRKINLNYDIGQLEAKIKQVEKHRDATPISKLRDELDELIATLKFDLENKKIELLKLELC